MNTKIAIPLANGRLSVHFGHCEQFALITIENNEIIREEIVNPPEHFPGSYPNFLAGQGVKEVIAGGIGGKAVDIFRANGIQVHTGAQPKSLRELAEDFVKDRLQTGANDCHNDGTC
jgi:predicted Fe-Mo cluster-binding NifX family protein